MAVLQILIALSYPALVYFGLRVMSPRQLSLWVGAALVARLLLTAPAKLAAYSRMFWLPVVAVAGISAATAASNHPFALLLTPVLINLGMLSVFAGSFLQAETTVERLARIQVPELAANELEYCRRVTALWCGFFLLNGGSALVLALHGNLELWTLYTGAIGYVLMGAIFAAEYLYRHWRFRRYLGMPLDPLLKFFFPPHARNETPEEPRTPRLDPEVWGESYGPGFLHQDLCVPQNLDVWPGHFPEYAIVPGVLQLRWVLDRIHRLSNFSNDGSDNDSGQKKNPACEIETIEALKFKRPLLPGQKFRLEVQVSGHDPNRFRFRLSEGGSVFSSGAFFLRGTEPP